MKMDEEEEDLHQRAFLFLNPDSEYCQDPASSSQSETTFSF